MNERAMKRIAAQCNLLRRTAVAAAAGVLCVFTACAYAGGVPNLAAILANSSQGREFYIAFPQNLIDPGVAPNVLDLSCFIASNYNATGRLQILGPGNTIVWDTTFTVDSQSVTTIGIPHKYNLQAEIQDIENEMPVRKAVHITTDKPAVVYGMSHRPYTADGYLAIPPGSWGTDYRVAGYYGVTTTNAVDAKLNATSEFAIVARYDSTRINIHLTADTRDVSNNKLHYAGEVIPIVLNTGQVYQMQAYTDATAPEDLSMTEIQSSKPVGVIAGSKCADIPQTYWACDYVIEMLPPLASWGKEYFTYQFDTRRVGGDVWRVYPMQDNTTITINGVNVGTISTTGSPPWYEISDLNNTQLKNAAHWTFNKPVMMVQYIAGEQYDGSDTNGTNYGDPSDVVLETREQFATSLVYATPPDSFGYIPPNGVQYVNVFIDGTNGLEDSLYVDGNPVRKLPLPRYFLSSSAPVPGTNFWMFHIQVPGGIHHLSALTPFSAYAVGFKSYESYAWPCALSLKLIGTKDTIPPVLPGQLTCGTLVDTLTDLPPVDSVRSNLAQAGDDSTGIGWVRNGTFPDTTYNFDDNVFVSDPNFIPGDSSAIVTIHVTNLRNKAHGALYAIDRAGNDTTFYYDYDPDSVAVSPYFLNFGKISAGVTKTDTIVIRNPRADSVHIDSIWLAAGIVFKITGGAQPPLTLAAGDSQVIIITFTPVSDSGYVRDTVMIAFDCFARPLATLGGGSGKPCVFVENLDFGTLTLDVQTNSAQKDSTVEIYNPGSDTLIVSALTLGGADAAAFTIMNPSVPLTQPIVVLPGDSLTVSVRFTATVSRDYSATLTVSSDANRMCADSVATLLGAGQAPGPGIAGYDWGRKRVACSFVAMDGFTITNTGTSPDTLIGLKVLSSTNDFIFSVAQLPLPISAGATRTITVTFTPSDTGSRNAFIEADFKSGVVRKDTLLRGTGVHPLIEAQDLDFGAQTVGQFTDSLVIGLNVPKQFGDTLTINSLAIAGADAGDFAILNAVTPRTLPDTGDTMQVRLRFTPSAVGLRTAQLCFNHDGTFATCKTDTQYCVNLTGTGIAPGLTVDNWNAGRVFITTTSDGSVALHNAGVVAAHVDSLWLSQNVFFHVAPGFATFNFDVPADSSIPVPLTFTPLDTVMYYDTVNVANNTQSPLVRGYVQGEGKVAVFTAVVPGGIHATPGAEVRIPIVVPEGYTRPSALTPGDPTPLDSGAINDVKLGLEADPTVLQPAAADNSIFDLSGTLANGYTASRSASANDSVVFELTGGAPLRDSGTVVWVKYLTLFTNVTTIPIYDTASTSVPWVLWKLIPGTFAVDSICGFGPHTQITYTGAAALGQSSPNPAMAAAGGCTIPFSLAQSCAVQLSVFNALGERVALLVDGALPKGDYAVRLDVAGLPAGIYCYRLIAGGVTQARTLMVVH